MHFFRRLGLGLCATLFSLTIFLFATFVSIYYVFDSPKPVESALQQSGVYDVAVQNVLQQEQKNQDSNDANIPLDNSAVQSAVQSALPPRAVQANAEKVINSFYGWIHGTTKTPDFSVDLGSSKNQIADNIGSYLRTKLNALPVCKTAVALPQNTADIFSMTCRPAGVSVDTIVNEVESQARGNAVIKDSSLTANNLKDSSGQTVTDKLNYVPKLHHYYILSLFILPVLIALSALGVIFASATRRAGLRRISFTLITTGIYSAAIALLAVWALNHFASNITNMGTDQQLLASKLIKAVDILATDLRKWWLGFGIGYVVLGLIGWLVVHLTRPKVQAVTLAKESSLGHNMNIPQAGTTFAPKDETPVSSTPPTPDEGAPIDKPDEHMNTKNDDKNS